MTSHWPVAFVVLLLAAATVLGLLQHDQAANATNRTAAEKASNAAAAKAAPEPGKADLPPEKPVPTEVKPAALPAPAVAPVAEVRPAAAAQPVAPDRTAAGAAPVTKPATPAVGAVNPAAVIPGEAGGPPRRESRTVTLANLRTALQAKLGVLPMDLAAGGFAVSTDGVRVEVQPVPNWSISLYNINPKTPEVETPKFKACLETAAEGLGLDLTQKGVQSDNGKTYLKATSKIGIVSVVRDPANGNSCVIRPIQALVPQPANANQPADAVAPKPAEHRPKPAAGPPVAPPRPPATDNNF